MCREPLSEGSASFALAPAVGLSQTMYYVLHAKQKGYIDRVIFRSCSQ